MHNKNSSSLKLQQKKDLCKNYFYSLRKSESEHGYVKHSSNVYNFTKVFLQKIEKI